MNRNEAEQLMGSLVITGSIKGGLYIGELVEIIPSKPFRANVKIKGVLQHPELYNHNTTPLCFKDTVTVLRENEIVNTGNSILKYEDILVSYDDSLKNALSKYLSSVENQLNGFIHDRRYSTRYINNEEDCIILRDMLVEKIKYITELQTQKDFFGIISIDGDVESLINERLNFSQIKAEVIKDICELTIGSTKVTLKYTVSLPFKFDPPNNFKN